MENYILGIDVSTSACGFALFTENGEINDQFVYEPTLTKEEKLLVETDRLFIKADNTLEFLKQRLKEKKITKIIIEEPLQSSNNQFTILTLKFFNGVLSTLCRQEYGVTPVYISSKDARSFGIPELMGFSKTGKKKTLFGAYPKVIEGEKVDKKLMVLHQIGKRYPNITWQLNNNMTLDKKNCDIADAIVCVLGQQAKEGLWEAKVCSDENLINFIVYNISYKRMVKQLKGNKEYTPKEKNELKKKYMLDEFKIQNYLNIVLS